jgi:hypothetical protein
MAGTETLERLLTPREVERIFRLTHGDARKACAAGEIRCATRQRGGHTCYLIDPKDAYEKWGPK